MATPEQRARRIALWKEFAVGALLYVLIFILPALADSITS